VKDRYGKPERGGSEWEPIKILLEGDGDSNKTNTTSNTCLRLTTQVGQAHAATEVLLDLETNKQPSEPKHTNTHSGKLHGLLPMLHRLDRWPAPVKPVDRASQVGGYSSRTTSVPESPSHFSRPWNKNTPKTQPARKENPTQSLAKRFQTDQELTSSTTTQKHTSQAVHSRQIPQLAYTGQTGQAWAARDKQHPRVNSSKTNSRSLESLHGFAQDFGDSRNTSCGVHSKVYAHQILSNQEESKKSRQELL
jgi:hypothetical protein